MTANMQDYNPPKYQGIIMRGKGEGIQFQTNQQPNTLPTIELTAAELHM